MANVSSEKTLRKFLENELRQRDWSLRQLAEASGVDHSTLSKLMRRDNPPSPKLETLVGLSNALGVGLVTLLQLAFPDLQRAEVNMDALLLAERIEKLPAIQRDFIDSYILGVLLKKSDQTG